MGALDIKVKDDRWQLVKHEDPEYGAYNFIWHDHNGCWVEVGKDGRCNFQDCGQVAPTYLRFLLLMERA